MAEKRGVEGIALVFMFVLLLIAVLSITLTSESDFAAVAFSFSPSFLFIIICFVLEEKDFLHNRALFWTLPFVLCVLFFFAASALTPRLDILNLTFLNLAICLVFMAMLSFMGFFEKSIEGIFAALKEEEPKAAVKQAEKQNLDEYILSIEDKCKAINFVIGRVYSVHNGGTKEIRDIIRIPQEWYNHFSSIAHNITEDNKVQVISLLNELLERLNILYETESRVFGDMQHRLKNLKRDTRGRSKVIEVIVANDKDPVQNYVESAIDYCLKTKKALRQ